MYVENESLTTALTSKLNYLIENSGLIEELNYNKYADIYHANSMLSTRINYVYKIREAMKTHKEYLDFFETHHRFLRKFEKAIKYGEKSINVILKCGVTACKFNKNGELNRPFKQIRKLNTEYLNYNITGFLNNRTNALKYERLLMEKHFMFGEPLILEYRYATMYPYFKDMICKLGWCKTRLFISRIF